MHLAGVVFRKEAERLEQRLLGAGEAAPDVSGLRPPPITLARRDVDDSG